MKTLVLNRSYLPLFIASYRKAVKLYFLDKADIVETYDEVLRSPSTQIEIPSVIKLKDYNKVVYYNVPLTKRNIYIRDNYRCGYTGKKIKNREDLSIDHIIPKSKGGPTNWTNLVTAHRQVNIDKGDYQIGVDPEVDHLEKPKVGKPHSLLIMQRYNQEIPECWKPFLYNI